GLLGDGVLLGGRGRHGGPRPREFDAVFATADRRLLRAPICLDAAPLRCALNPRGRSRNERPDRRNLSHAVHPLCSPGGAAPGRGTISGFRPAWRRPPLATCASTGEDGWLQNHRFGCRTPQVSAHQGFALYNGRRTTPNSQPDARSSTP